jgi:ornithine cyclodeaminase/alanine dehydrogenase-like protein (mu-crystallin family)
VEHVAIIGAGIQGHFQLEALLDVRQPSEIRVFDIDDPKACQYVEDMAAKGVKVERSLSAEEAVKEAQVVVTTTPSREPHLRFEWLSAGCHVTAVGADMPAKRELFASVLSKADKLVVHRLSQCLAQGELHHAVAEGALTQDNVHGELGEIAAGMKAGRTHEDEITVADLTGVGVQDAAIAGLVVVGAKLAGVGRPLAELEGVPGSG